MTKSRDRQFCCDGNHRLCDCHCCYSSTPSGCLHYEAFDNYLYAPLSVDLQQECHHVFSQIFSFFLHNSNVFPIFRFSERQSISVLKTWKGLSIISLKQSPLPPPFFLNLYISCVTPSSFPPITAIPVSPYSFLLWESYVYCFMLPHMCIIKTLWRQCEALYVPGKILCSEKTSYCYLKFFTLIFKLLKSH